MKKKIKIKLNEQNFQNLVSYWAGKLHLPLPFFRIDNRMIWLGHICYCKDCKVYNFTYNFKRFKTLSDSEVMGAIFHELGHIKYYKLKKTEIQNEYIAEKFSLKYLKKYYPDYVKSEIESWKKLIKKECWRKKYPQHAKAFDKIKEYK